MPIPRYDSPQVGIAPVQNARMNPGAAPNLMGVVGQGLAQATEGFSGIVQQAETLRAEEALNKLRSKQQEYTAWLQELKGKNAFDPSKYGGEEGSSLQKTALGWFDAAAQEVGKGLSPHAQKVFKSGADRFRLEFDGHVQNHEARETAVVASDTYKGAQIVEDQNISQNAIAPDGRIQMDTIGQSISRKVFAANQISEFLGESPDMRQARELEARSGAHALVLDGLLKQNNAQGARAYFDINKGQMDSRVTSFMAGKIQQSILANDVQTKAQELDGSGLGLEDQLAKVDELSKGNPELQKALSSEVEHRFQVRKTAERVAEQETIGKLWDMRYPTIPGSRAVPMSQIMRSTEWASLDGAQRNQLASQWESHAKRNENDPTVKVGQFAAYMRILDDPKTLMNLTDAQLASLTGSLGPQYAINLMEMKRKAAGNLESLKSFSLNDIPFKDIAGEYGLRVKGSLGDEDLAKLGSLRTQTIEAIRAEQEATGKLLAPDRKEEILRKLLTEVSTKKKGDFFARDKQLFEVKDFMELEATDAEKTQAVSILVEAEAPITPANVQTMIDAMRKRKP